MYQPVHVRFSQAPSTRDLGAACIAHSIEEADELLARAARDPHRVVGPYLADVMIAANGPTPTHFREVFRTRGPSNRPDLGRQAAGPQERL